MISIPNQSDCNSSNLLATLEQERAARLEAELRLRAAEATLLAAQRIETYFRHLIEYSLDLITILEADGTIRFESRSVTKELGWEPEDYRGRNAFEFVHSEDVTEVAAAFARALELHGSTPLLSFRFRKKDGSYRILEGRGNNLLDDPAVRGIVFNSRDVTEQRQLEAQFQQAQKVQALGQLTGGVAHDFNNILTAIIGYADLAQPRVEASSTAAHCLEEINKAAMRAAELTRQLLAFSRQQVLQPRVINLASVLSEMDKMLRRLLGEHISLIVRTSEMLGNVRADPNQIEQVLLNLAVNARDAMHGGGCLTIEIGNVELDGRYAAIQDGVEPGSYVLLAVSDTGAGIPPEVLSHIFEPFFTTKEQGRGTGLGLATCHGIVKQSGGHMTVYTEVGKGTTFRVYLPRVDAAVDVVTTTRELPINTTRGETVLLVEDEPTLRELGVTVLEDLGYKVLSAENGARALDLLRSDSRPPIDLLLTDVVMPEMGGQELVAQLRDLSPTTKVIYCSGYTEDAIFHSGSLGPGVHFLQKPYSVAAISRKVQDVLQIGG